MANHFRESRILSQRRESRVRVQGQELETAVFDGLGQVLQTRLDVIEGEVDGRELDR